MTVVFDAVFMPCVYMCVYLYWACSSEMVVYNVYMRCSGVILRHQHSLAGVYNDSDQVWSTGLCSGHSGQVFTLYTAIV